MSKEQLEHFRNILNSWKRDLMVEVDRTVSHMKDEAANFPDPNDRATQEEEFSLELRTRDRERKLIRKIDEALKRIEDGSLRLLPRDRRGDRHQAPRGAAGGHPEHRGPGAPRAPRAPVRRPRRPLPLTPRALPRPHRGALRRAFRTLAHRRSAPRLAGRRPRQLPRRPQPRRSLAAAHGGSRYGARGAGVRCAHAAHARELRPALGRCGRLSERAHRALRRGTRAAERRRPHLRVQLLAARARQPRAATPAPAAHARPGPDPLRCASGWTMPAPCASPIAYRASAASHCASAATSSSGAATAPSPTSSRWWSMMHCKVSATWSAAPTSSTAPPGRSRCRTPSRLPRPRYAHLPLVVEPGGAKLAKSRRSMPLDPGSRGSSSV